MDPMLLTSRHSFGALSHVKFLAVQVQDAAPWMLAPRPGETQEAEFLKLGEKVRVKMEMYRGREIKEVYRWGEGIWSFLCGAEPTVMRLIMFLKKHVQVRALYVSVKMLFLRNEILAEAIKLRTSV